MSSSEQARKPVVSIITPNLNRAHTIAETLESLVRQTSPQWECVVVDDGSTDGSEAVVKSYSESDSRITWHVRANKPAGACTCRNIGVGLATGDYVMFLDSDDIAAEHCVAQRLEAATANPDADILVFPTMMFRTKPGDLDFLWNVITGEPELHRFMRLDSPWQGTGPLWKKQAFVSMGGWDDLLACWQDIDLSMRALSEGLRHNILYDLPPDVYLRCGDGTTISSSSLYSASKLASKRRVLSRALKLAGENNIDAVEREGRMRAARVMAFSVIRDHVRGGFTRHAAGILSGCARGLFKRKESALIALDMLAMAPGLRLIPGAKRIGALAARRFAQPDSMGVQRVAKR